MPHRAIAHIRVSAARAREGVRASPRPQARPRSRGPHRARTAGLWAGGGAAAHGRGAIGGLTSGGVALGPPLGGPQVSAVCRGGECGRSPSSAIAVRGGARGPSHARACRACERCARCGACEGRGRKGARCAYPYDACWPPVYTVLLDHAATPPQLPAVGELLGGLLGAVAPPAHALTGAEHQREARREEGQRGTHSRSSRRSRSGPARRSSSTWPARRRRVSTHTCEDRRRRTSQMYLGGAMRSLASLAHGMRAGSETRGPRAHAPAVRHLRVAGVGRAGGVRWRGARGEREPGAASRGERVLDREVVPAVVCARASDRSGQVSGGREGARTVRLGRVPEHDAAEGRERLAHLHRDARERADGHVARACGRARRGRADVHLHVLVRADRACPVVPACSGERPRWEQHTRRGGTQLTRCQSPSRKGN